MTKQEISPQHILEELAAIAFARVPECLTVTEGEVSLKSRLPPAQRAAVASVEKTSNGLRIKFYDKLKALELLGKHFGLFAGEETQDNQEQNNLLAAILEATRQEAKENDL